MNRGSELLLFYCYCCCSVHTFALCTLSLQKVYHFKAAQVDKSHILVIHHKTSLIMLGHIDSASDF